MPITFETLLGTNDIAFKFWPITRRAISVLFIVLMTGCSTQGQKDPFERVNRGVHHFNEAADHWVLKPIARGYRWMLPDFIEKGISNLFSNLVDPIVALNQLLQGKPSKAASDTGRFLLNSTLGIAGLFDVASGIGLEKHHEDFGQTFGVWGVPDGPFIVVPFWGPSTPRDGVGSVIGSYGFAPRYLDDVGARNIGYALWVINKRAEFLAAEKLISGDRYLFIRDAYLQRRAYLTSDGSVEDEFLDE